MVHQSYEPRVIDEDVLRGNSAIVKCSIPSFVADYVNVIEWITDEESLSAFSFNGSDGNYGNRERPPDPNCPYPLSTNSSSVNHSVEVVLTCVKHSSGQPAVRVAGVRYVRDTRKRRGIKMSHSLVCVRSCANCFLA